MGRALDQRLNEKIKTVWRISDLIILLLFGLPFVLIMLGVFLSTGEGWLTIPLMIAVVAFVVTLILVLFVIPPIRYVRWRYSLSQEYLEIQKGIIWRKHYLIPFIRVQNTDTSQGPLLRLFGLSSVTVSTAAGEHVIPGLDQTTAEAVRDKAAEFARMAREDV